MKRPQSLITYELILLTQGELSQLSRRNTLDAAYLLRTSRSDSMVRAGQDETLSRKRGTTRSSKSISSNGRKGTVVNKVKVEPRHIVIERKKKKVSVSEGEPKIRLQYAINREEIEEEEQTKGGDDGSIEEESKSSSSSDEAKSYVIPEDDDMSTVGIMEEV